MTINNFKKFFTILSFLAIFAAVVSFLFIKYLEKTDPTKNEIFMLGSAIAATIVFLTLILWIFEKIKKKKALDLLDPSLNPKEDHDSSEESFSSEVHEESYSKNPNNQDNSSDEQLSNLEKKELPIKILIGYQPDVLARDAKEYAIGLAHKHFSDVGLAFWGVYEYENGFVFEIHEGGPGKAYGPEIIKFFQEQGPFDNSKQNELRIKTATRTVQVLRKERGLAGILLPENSTKEDSGIVPLKALEPCIDRRTKLLKFSMIIAGSGIAALLICGSFFRLQPFEEIKTTEHRVSAGNLPIFQWNRIVLGPSEYLKTLQFKDGKWSHDKAFEGMVPSAASAPALNSLEGATQ